MIAYSMMVASHGGITSGVCTPSMNQNADSSYSRRSSLHTVEYAYRSRHPPAPGGVGISNGLGNRSAMMFLLGTKGADGHHWPPGDAGTPAGVSRGRGRGLPAWRAKASAESGPCW